MAYGSFDPAVARHSELMGSNPGCHRSRVYTVLQTDQRPGLRSDVYDTVHYKEPLFD